MDDLISMKAALNALGEEPPVWYDGEDEIAERDQWRRDVAAIKAVLPVDAVPVVRCADCIRYHPDDDVWGQCSAAAYGIRRTDFCSYGVRKDGDGND